MRTPTMLAAILGIGILSSPVAAQTINQREANQQRRIDNGVASGRLTPGEAYRDQRQQASINAQEARMRARSGGTLTPYQRGRLHQRQANANRHIYNSKHNWRGR